MKDPNNNVIYPGAPSVGLSNVGSYQAAGYPFITGSQNLDDGKVHMVEVPYVAKKVRVVNVSAVAKNIQVHFQSGSATAVTVPGEAGAQTITAGCDVLEGLHFMSIPQNTSLELTAKFTKLYISNTSGTDDLRYQVLAELTNIPKRRMPHLTGSGITE